MNFCCRVIAGPRSGTRWLGNADLSVPGWEMRWLQSPAGSWPAGLCAAAGAACSRLPGPRLVPAACRGLQRPARRSRWSVVLVHGNVEAGLLKLLFHVDLAGSLQTQQLAPHPRHLRTVQALLWQCPRSHPSGADSRCRPPPAPRSRSHASAASGTPLCAPRSSLQSACETLLHAPVPGRQESVPSTTGNSGDGPQDSDSRSAPPNGQGNQQLVFNAARQIRFVFDPLQAIGIQARVLPRQR